MPKTITISLDAMGGDAGPEVVLPGAAIALERRPDLRFVLFGDEARLKPLLEARPALAAASRMVHTDVVVRMDDKPSQALRAGRWKSSMWKAIEAVKTGEAQVCVSAGNTGALMAVARYLLKTLEGIDRPAIASVMPNQHGHYTTMLDLGANVDCSAEHLLQFAVMGSALVSALDGTERPTVGLLNIGEEAIKGNDVIKRAGELLREADARQVINFQGNVEGNDIFKGTTDLVVCDGFVGNVALKTAEGVAGLMAGILVQEFTGSLYGKLAALVAMPVLRRFKRRLDHRRYNGAALLGLRGLVFKSHGSADAFAFEQALNRAYDAARNRLLDRVHDRIIAAMPAMSGTQPEFASAGGLPPSRQAA
jgi:glycerol-3-phosphate acyltransferase PlsX